MKNLTKILASIVLCFAVACTFMSCSCSKGDGGNTNGGNTSGGTPEPPAKTYFSVNAISDASMGTIRLLSESTLVVSGGSVDVAVVPKPGYVFARLKVNGETYLTAGDVMQSHDLSLEMGLKVENIVSNTTIEAVFETAKLASEVSVTMLQKSGESRQNFSGAGKVAYAGGNRYATNGGKLVFEITAFADYEIKEISVDGGVNYFSVNSLPDGVTLDGKMLTATIGTGLKLVVCFKPKDVSAKIVVADDSYNFTEKLNSQIELGGRYYLGAGYAYAYYATAEDYGQTSGKLTVLSVLNDESGNKYVIITKAMLIGGEYKVIIIETNRDDLL